MRVDFHFVQENGKTGAKCSACGAKFFDSKGRKGNDCIQKCIDHAKREHKSEGGEFKPEESMPNKLTITPSRSNGQPEVRPFEPELTPILRSWSRSLDIVTVNGFDFVLRDTNYDFHGRAQSIVMGLSRPQLEKLHATISQLLKAA